MTQTDDGRPGGLPMNEADTSPAVGVPDAVIFLDFDGVICSPRAFVAQAARWDGHRSLRWADQIACDLVGELVRKHNAKIVVSSTWRSGRANCDDILCRYGLSRALHDDWRTGVDKERMRGREIADWLNRNGHPPYIILDDDSDMLPEQGPWLVHTCSMNGMMLADYDLADKLLAQAIEAHKAATLGAGHESPVRQDAPSTENQP